MVILLKNWYLKPLRGNGNGVEINGLDFKKQSRINKIREKARQRRMAGGHF